MASVDGAGRPRGLAKWRATGALAGFVIVLSLQVTLLKWLLPMPEQPFPDSYGAVRSFFRNLQAGQRFVAWNGLTDGFRHRVWENDFSRFEAGYKNVASLNLLAIAFVTAQSDFAHDYVVYFQDETRAPALGEFRSIADWRLSRLPEVVEIVTKIRNEMVRLDLPPEALDNLMIAQFISGKRADKLRWYLETGYGVSDFRGLFGEERKVTSVVGQLVRVQKSGRDWLIERIDGIPFDKEH